MAQIARERPPTRKSRLARGEKLRPAEIEAVVIAVREGKSTGDIARMIGCSDGAISNIKAKMSPTLGAARAYLESQAYTLARKAVTTGSADTCVDLLERLDVVAPRRSRGDGSTAVGVQVIIGQLPYGLSDSKD